jgi:hypothetical protein
MISATKFALPAAAIGAIAFITGCASQPKQTPVHEQGWIGGRYECAKARRTVSNFLFGADHTMFCFPAALSNVQSAAMLTLSLGTNTPAFLAGIREGDLILELGGRKATNFHGFRALVTSARPGASLPVKIYRDGGTMERTVTVGREKYEQTGSVALGLPGFWEGFHPVPTKECPQCSFGPLGFENPDEHPVEFASVRQRYWQSCHPKDKPEGYDGDWRFWCALLELKKGKKILAQETVEEQKSGQ